MTPPTSKRRRTSAHTAEPPLVDRLGKLVIRDLRLLNNSSLPSLLLHRRGASNITNLASITALRHPAHHLVRHIGAKGFPVVLKTAPWPHALRDAAV